MLSDRFFCVTVYGVPLNDESKTEDFLFFVFKSVSRANIVNMNAPPMVGFEVLTAVSTKMVVFWVVATCSLVEVYQRFRGPCCLHNQGAIIRAIALMMEAARTSETLVNFYQTTRRYNPEDSHLRAPPLVPTQNSF
jgi:hypothetical protein